MKNTQFIDFHDLLIFPFVTEPRSRKKRILHRDQKKWKNYKHTFNPNSIKIKRMFSKMQNCTSLDCVHGRWGAKILGTSHSILSPIGFTVRQKRLAFYLGISLHLSYFNVKRLFLFQKPSFYT